MSKEHCNCNHSQISRIAQYSWKSLEIVHLFILVGILLSKWKLLAAKHILKLITYFCR